MSTWYRNAIIYQIYPKSFQDSNGDGIGDLQGIRRRLPYLKELGINTIWLNPIFVSPQVDNGYDISNFYLIDQNMGTMEDVDSLISASHEIGIRIIFDFVLNHTSDQHPWFQEANHNSASVYRDYYIFTGKNNEPPNNWGSFFGGSVWEPDASGSGESYLHLFDKKMPDLNWQNPAVRIAMADVAKFWLSKGVDGLRLDAFIHIAKADLNQYFPAGPDDGDTVVAEPFFANLPNVQYWMKDFVDQIRNDYPDAFLLGEAASANVNLAVDYAAKKNRLLDSVVTFRYFTEDTKAIDEKFSNRFQPRKIDWVAFKQTQAIWQQTLQDVALPTLYLGNHDMARVATRLAATPIQSQSLAMLMMLQRGIPIIYYGDEIGLTNVNFDKPQELKDPEVEVFINSAEAAGKTFDEALEMVNQTHKLAARGTMLWTEGKGRGFSSAKPWNSGKLCHDIKSVEAQSKNDDSCLNFFKRLIRLKKQEIFVSGRFRLLNTTPDTYVYTRTLGRNVALVAVSLSIDSSVALSIPEGVSESFALTIGKVNYRNRTLTLAPLAGAVLYQFEEEL